MSLNNELTTVYLGIGSNIEPAENIDLAKAHLKQLFSYCEFSSTYETAAVGFKGDNFLNLVAKVKTDLSLEALISLIKQSELTLGRVRGSQKFADRHIDIDILLFNNLTTNHPIELPRQEIYHNAYVLWPLAEVAPNLVDPISKKTFLQLWNNFDKSTQTIVKIA